MLRGHPSRIFPIATAALIAAASAVYALQLDHSLFVTDDGGITLRYAERISQGLGFNYNAGEAVNGASSPLYTLLLSGMLSLGLGPRMAIFAIAVPAYAALTSLLFYTFTRYYSLFAGALSFLAILSANCFYVYLFDALETTLTLLLVALLFHSLHTRRLLYQGVVLGLLVSNKLDGSLAAISYAGVYLWVRHRFPFKVTAAAVVAALPVFCVLLGCFGSILPNSMWTKVNSHLTPGGFNPNWMNAALLSSLTVFYYPALLSFCLPGSARHSFARQVIQGWFVLHLASYSLIDLGAPYPWYWRSPALMLVILAIVAADHVYQLGRVARAERKSGVVQRVAGVALVLAFAGVCFVNGASTVYYRIAGADPGPDVWAQLPPPAEDNLARQAAGAWLNKYTSRTERVQSSFGLPSFEYKGPVYDATRLNSHPDPRIRNQVAYRVSGNLRGSKLMLDPPGTWRVVAVFQYARHRSAYAVYARSGSEIIRQGRYFLPFDLAKLVPVAHPSVQTAAAGSADTPAGEPFVSAIPGRLVYDLVAPAPPTLFCAPALEVRAESPGAVVVRVLINGEEVHRETLQPGEEAARRRVRSPRPDPDQRYRLQLIAEPLEPGGGAGSSLRWEDLQIAIGEPLVSEDFSLSCTPWANRVDYVARHGLR